MTLQISELSFQNYFFIRFFQDKKTGYKNTKNKQTGAVILRILIGLKELLQIFNR
jgi:hypothetical protein